MFHLRIMAGVVAPLDNPRGRYGPSYRSEAVTSRDQLNEQRVHRLAG
jgi:hypothetical protein